MTTEHKAGAPATVEKARREELEGLARVLARAFHDDPVLTWILREDPDRLAINTRFFRLGLSRMWLKHDETYAAPGPAGVAVWEPPGTWKVGVGAQLALGPGMARAFGRYLPRVLAALSQMQKHHPREPHYYLPFVGVDPDHQGRGIGSALLQPVLARCDADGVPAYLEASSERNRVLYERHGFVVMRELRVGRGAPPMWPMWRTAQTS